jgi:energy-coupling factor transporter ATP-binding protein EcfA2
MKLQSIKYSQFDGRPNEWNLDRLDLGPINLIVGRNATGKTKTVKFIYGLAELLSGRLKPMQVSSANFDVIFQHEGKIYQYKVVIEDKAVISEEFFIGEKCYLNRHKEGVGEIFAEQLDEYIKFQTPDTELGLISRRDNIQHSYFEPLYEWANSVYFYNFSTTFGRDKLGLFNKDLDAELDPKNSEFVVGIYEKGDKEFPNKFKEMILTDLKKINYQISDIGLAPPVNLIRPVGLKGELMGLWVQEADLNSKTEQNIISNGMFRALSLIIQLNYSKMALKPSCILIDDIGEGLDYERSCALIELIIDKAMTSDIQLVMSTNDRFVMNKVPLEMWIVLNRRGARCQVFNIHTSKEKFDQFKYTGLNNFDLFATDYLINEDVN